MTSDHGPEVFVENRRTWVEVDVNDRVDLHVAVNLKVWVDVEVVVEVQDPVTTAEALVRRL